MKVKRFNLKRIDENFTGVEKYRIVGLKAAHYINSNNLVNGSVALLRDWKNPGYVTLCRVCHSDDECPNFGNFGSCIEVEPIVTTKGERILIKYDYDDMFCMISTGDMDYDKVRFPVPENWRQNEENFMDATLKILKPGGVTVPKWDE